MAEKADAKIVYGRLRDIEERLTLMERKISALHDLDAAITMIQEVWKKPKKKRMIRSNHELGCDLEAVAQTIEFRGLEKEGVMLREVASKLK